MGELWGQDTELKSQPQKDKYCIIPLRWGTKSSEIHSQEVEGWLSGAEGEENEELFFNEYRVSA